MSNKEIQEQRMRGYFIQATKEMLKGEGMKSISVRGIAERAGYSFATIYNYFRDVNELVFHCVEDFYQECVEFVDSRVDKNLVGKEAIKAKSIEFANYFLDYPGIFDIFFLEKINTSQRPQATIDVIVNALDNICQDDWNYCIENNLVDDSDARILKTQLKNSIAGMLLFKLNRNYPADYQEFQQEMKQQLGIILG